MNEESEVSLSLFVYMQKKEANMIKAKKKREGRRYFKRRERLKEEAA